MYKKILFETFMGLLDSFSDFRDEFKDYYPAYIKEELISSVLLSKYHIKDIAGNRTDLEKVLNLLEWVSQNVQHNGGMLETYKGKIDAVSLLEHSFQKEAKYGLNCLYLSYVLAECLITLGIKARPISMMPMSPYDEDNHVVVMAYIESLHKWIMIDPTYGGYLLNEDSVILDLIEIREAYSKRKNLVINEAFHYNNCSPEELEQVKDIYHMYMAKNSFAYYTFETIEQGKINQSRRVDFCPVGYSVAKRYQTKGHNNRGEETFNYLDIYALRQ
ncbi:MAG: transglutaminase-like domain-containing protein [Firmicutes bacterium]|nr:transglutaminase-like domain-containing protein [Bacillota bacterium]